MGGVRGDSSLLAWPEGSKGIFCSVFECLNYMGKRRDLSFFRFPTKRRNQEQRELWIRAMKMGNWTPGGKSAVCGDHFVNGKPNTANTDPDYVPTVFPTTCSKKDVKRIDTGQGEREIDEDCKLGCKEAGGNGVIVSRKKKTQSPVCCVPGCTGRGKGDDQTIKFFRFPTKSERCRTLWIEAIGRKNEDGSDWQPSSYSQICSKHFVTGRKSLMKFDVDYVPTVFTDFERTVKSLPGAGSNNNYLKLTKWYEAEKRKSGRGGRGGSQGPIRLCRLVRHTSDASPSYHGWRRCPSSTAEKGNCALLKALYDDDLSKDVTLIGHDGRVGCHRAVLSAASEFLKELLCATRDDDETVIHLPHFSAQVLSMFLQRCYCIATSNYQELEGDAVSEETKYLLKELRVQSVVMVGENQKTILDKRAEVALTFLEFPIGMASEKMLKLCRMADVFKAPPEVSPLRQIESLENSPEKPEVENEVGIEAPTENNLKQFPDERDVLMTDVQPPEPCAEDTIVETSSHAVENQQEGGGGNADVMKMVVMQPSSHQIEQLDPVVVVWCVNCKADIRTTKQQHERLVESLNQTREKAGRPPLETIAYKCFDCLAKPINPINLRLARQRKKILTLDEELCADCGKFFKRMRKHACDHEGGRRRARQTGCIIKCEVEGCDYETRKRMLMDNHMERVHPGVATTKIQCDKCPAMVQPERMKRHQLCHDESLPYGCEECSFRGKTNFSISLHYTRVHQMKPFVCKLGCKARFNKRYAQRKHMQLHCEFSDPKITTTTAGENIDVLDFTQL